MLAALALVGIVSLTAIGCSAKTTTATQITQTTAVLNATASWNKGEEITYWFETRASGKDWVRDQVNSWKATNSASNQAIQESVNGLIPDTDYDFRICSYVKEPDGSQYGSLNNPLCVDKNGTATSSSGNGEWSHFTTPPLWRPYADTSPFNTRLTPERKQQISPDSQTAINSWLATWNNDLRQDDPDGNDAPHKPGFKVGYQETEDWDRPIFWSNSSDPLATINYTENWGNGNGALGQSIPIPTAAQAAGGIEGDAWDGHMAVITNGWEYDFWQVQPVQQPVQNGVINSSYGGRTLINGDGLGSGGTESNFGLLAGIIRPDELKYAKINHALVMVMECSNGEDVWPAADGKNHLATCDGPSWIQNGMPPYGAQFFLDYTEQEINNKSWPVWEKAIARAASRYGIYFGDTGGSTFKIQSGLSSTALGQPDPWIKIAKDYGLTRQGQNHNGPYKFNLTKLTGDNNHIDWANRLKMLTPAQSW